jgi:hypothetical protein
MQKTTTVHKTDTLRTTVKATVRKTATVTRDVTASVSATARVTLTDDVTVSATATAMASVTITPTTSVTVTAAVTATDDVTVTATATETDFVTVVVGCHTATPTPDGDTCGTNYIYIGESDEKVISEGESSTVEACAESCSETSGCLSIAFSALGDGGNIGFCNLYSASVAQLNSGNLIALPSVGGQDAQAFYDIGCFTCPAITEVPKKRWLALDRADDAAGAKITMTETVERTRVETVVDMRVQTLWKWRGAQ